MIVVGGKMSTSLGISGDLLLLIITMLLMFLIFLWLLLLILLLLMLILLLIRGMTVFEESMEI